MIERAKRTKVLLAVLAIGALAVSVAAVALGQDDGSAGQAAAPQDTSSSADVPKGPYVDFCPTPEQTEAHLKAYGFDYKPTVGCNLGGEVPSRAPPRGSNGDPADLSNDQACEHEKELLQSAKPLPDSDNDPTTIAGELPDGREVIVDVFTDDPKHFEGRTINDLAKDSC